jgi:hypothetical protein
MRRELALARQQALVLEPELALELELEQGLVHKLSANI